MKKTLLISGAFLTSIAAFAQTNVKTSGSFAAQTTMQKGTSETSTKGSANLSATGKTNPGNTVIVNGKTGSGMKEQGSKTGLEKNAVGTKEKVRDAAIIDTRDQQTSVSQQTGNKINTTIRDNNLHTATSIKSETTVSKIPASANRNTLKTVTKNIHTGTDKLEATGSVATNQGKHLAVKAGKKISRFSEKTTHGIANTAHSIHPKITPVHINSGVTALGSIKIK